MNIAADKKMYLNIGFIAILNKRVEHPNNFLYNHLP